MKQIPSKLKALLTAMVALRKSDIRARAIRAKIDTLRKDLGYSEGVCYSANDASISFAISLGDYLTLFPESKPTIKTWQSMIDGSTWACSDWPPCSAGTVDGLWVWVTPHSPAQRIADPPANWQPSPEQKVAKQADEIIQTADAKIKALQAAA